jgi:hypothetical protein
MSRGRAGTALAIAAIVLAAGCGTTTGPRRHGTSDSWPSVSLNTSAATAAGSWAVVVMGGSAARHNAFWQLLTRPAGASSWTVVTPPGTADNGGLVIAAGAHALISAFRPSQDLTYTPLIQTSSGGRSWDSLNPLQGAAAKTPDALAMGPGGELVALLTSGTAMTAVPPYATWKSLTSSRSLAATPAGRRCGLRHLTAVAFTPQGTPLLAGACGKPGTPGIFTLTHGTWQAAGPTLPGAMSREAITALSLSQTPGWTAVLLEAGSGARARLLVASSRDGGGRWALSAPFPLDGASVSSASLLPGGTAAIELTTGRGVTSAVGQPWRALPPLPPGTATLTAGPRRGTVEALAVRRARLTVWQTVPGSLAWTRTQIMNVPILFGSSD